MGITESTPSRLLSPINDPAAAATGSPKRLALARRDDRADHRGADLARRDRNRDPGDRLDAERRRLRDADGGNTADDDHQQAHPPRIAPARPGRIDLDTRPPDAAERSQDEQM